MRDPKSLDYLLLATLALIWASAFFNIKIATYSFGPITIAFFRIFLGAIPVVILCLIKNIKIEAFSKNWKPYALIGLCNIAIPFTLIAIGTAKINSYLAAMLMSTTPMSAYGFQFLEKASILIFLYLQSKNKGMLANTTLIKARVNGSYE